MGTVLPFPSQAELDAAWSAYEALCKRERDDSTLSHDRAHVEARIRAHDHFQQLFLANERKDNVVRIAT